jgi:hypothetical protein
MVNYRRRITLLKAASSPQGATRIIVTKRFSAMLSIKQPGEWMYPWDQGNVLAHQPVRERNGSYEAAPQANSMSHQIRAQRGAQNSQGIFDQLQRIVPSIVSESSDRAI